jgi:selenocysteine lyase/cysteine desulfurase
MLNRDIKEYRQYFPVTDQLIYLNHAGVSPVSLQVKQAVETFLEESTQKGILAVEKWYRRAEEIRQKISEFVGAGKDEITFVRSTSHGLALVAEGIDWKEGENVVTASCEFPSNVYPWLNLARRGVETRLVQPRQGEVHLSDIQDHICSKTRVVSLSWVEYQNGFTNDLEAVGSYCHERGIYFCVDGIQGIGALPLNLSELHVDFCSADGHKWILAPEGVGFLYVSERVMDRIHPVIVGWHSVKNALDFENLAFTLREDARKFEEGSHHMMGIFALGAAVNLLAEIGVSRVWGHVSALCDQAVDGMQRKGYEILSPLAEKKRSGILTFRSKRRSTPELFRRLTEAQMVVAVRAGGIRISPHFYNTAEEMERFLEIL